MKGNGGKSRRRFSVTYPQVGFTILAVCIAGVINAKHLMLFIKDHFIVASVLYHYLNHNTYFCNQCLHILHTEQYVFRWINKTSSAKGILTHLFNISA